MSETDMDILSDSDLDHLAEATLTVLERAGAMYQSDVILDALEKAGASVNRATQRARLPRRMIESIVARQKKRQELRETPGGPRRRPPAAEADLPGITLHIAQFYFDHERGERRPGNRADLIGMTKFGEALDARQSVDQVLLMTEEPPAIEPLEGLLVLLEHSSRPGVTYPHFAGQFPYFEEIGEICAGDPNRYLVGSVFLVSPLRMDRRACDYLVGKLRRGLPCGTSTQPVSGVSAPVTRAGTIVVGAAEVLAGWAAVVALDPDAPLSGNIESGVVDMPSGNVHFGAPEPLLQDLGCVELFRRRFGGHVGIAGSGNYTAAKFPGHQAGFERLFDGMAVFAHTGQHPYVGSGLLDSGKMFSPLQLLIDRELQSLIWRFLAGVAVDEGEIALDTITSVGSGIGRSYLETEHTLERYRDSLWFPRLLDRSVWKGERVEERPDCGLLERAQRQFREVMSRYRRPEVDPDMLARVRRVVDRARRELVETGG